MEKAASLTDYERKVLWGITKHPSLGDNELAGILNLGRSTVTSIRNRLREECIIHEVWAPDFMGLGCELLTVIHGDFNPSTPYEARRKYLPSQQFEQIFFVATTDLQHVSLSAAKNMTETQRYIEYMEEVYGQHDFLGHNGNSYIYFPLELSMMEVFFDFAPLLAKAYGLESATRPTTPIFGRKAMSKLRDSQRQVVYNLVKNPTATDGQIADATGLSRQSVNSARADVIEAGLIHPVVFPDMCKLGFRFMAFRHSRFKAGSDIKRREKEDREVLENPNLVFNISSNLQSASLSTYLDYNELEADRAVFMNIEDEHLKGEPVTRVFSIREQHLNFAQYAALTANALGVV